MSSSFRVKFNLPRSFVRSKVYLTALLISLLSIALLTPGLWQQTEAEQKPVDNSAVVQLVGPRTIAVQPGSLLEQKFNISDVQKDQITTPLLLVTGAVVARLPAGSSPIGRPLAI